MLDYNRRDLPIVGSDLIIPNTTLYIELQSGRRLLRRRCRRLQVLRLLHTRTLHYKTAINLYRYSGRYHLLKQKRRGQRRVVMCVCDAVSQTSSEFLRRKRSPPRDRPSAFIVIGGPAAAVNRIRRKKLNDRRTQVPTCTYIILVHHMFRISS